MTKQEARLAEYDTQVRNKLMLCADAVLDTTLVKSLRTALRRDAAIEEAMVECVDEFVCLFREPNAVNGRESFRDDVRAAARYIREERDDGGLREDPHLQTALAFAHRVFANPEGIQLTLEERTEYWNSEKLTELDRVFCYCLSGVFNALVAFAEGGTNRLKLAFPLSRSSEYMGGEK